MLNFDDISEMLSQGNFSDDHDPGEKNIFADLDLFPTIKPAHIEGQDPIFENPPELPESLGNDVKKIDLDNQEFFPPLRNDVAGDNPSPRIQNSNPPSPQSRNQTIDEVEDSQKNEQIKGKNYTKNILGYITKKSMHIMFKCYKKILIKSCKKLDIKYKQFDKHYKNIYKKIYGPQSLVELFQVDKDDPDDVKMKGLFNTVLTKIIRKRYLLYSIKLGKMQAIQTYIRKKNTHLLYFADELKNVLESSDI